MQTILIFVLNLVLLLVGGCKEQPSTAPIPNPIDSTSTENYFDIDYSFYESSSKVLDRNFYLLTLLEKYELGRIVESDEFNKQDADRKTKIMQVLESSQSKALDYCNPFIISDQIELTLNTEFEKLFSSNKSYDLLVEEMRVSGAFIQFREVTNNARFLQLAVSEAISGLNNIINVYGLGKPPLYPDIDSGDFDVTSSSFKSTLKDILSEISTSTTTEDMVFKPNLDFALKLLDINKRDEAGRYFPMQQSVNEKVFTSLPNIDWASFDYSVILVLGDSPNSAGDLPNISQGGMARADHGVKLWREGLAPIIAFSGGHLHPVHTPYSEAIEMKNYVMEKYGIPEDKILVDPHARHTTTNLRNIGRLMFRYGIPVDKPSIVSTSESHSEYVASDRFKTRSMSEMNHIPCVILDRLSLLDIEFTPKIEVLHLDSSDPLDP